MADNPYPAQGSGWYVAIDRFFFGLCFGIGFIVGSNVVTFIGSFFHK